ncbi:hypothetical protein BpHYR1_010255 [Brachionus plicatilis]|uniref:Uncharacterized protein n=1 Tax=Brachionus plicatilis TaxID=10195 RepID=A0A3M7R5I8_BRAPC|nr:hypothetical protein BpHYR1_010255 [Brachionus plicatilis]
MSTKLSICLYTMIIDFTILIILLLGFINLTYFYHINQTKSKCYSKFFDFSTQLPFSTDFSQISQTALIETEETTKTPVSTEFENTLPFNNFDSTIVSTHYNSTLICHERNKKYYIGADYVYQSCSSSRYFSSLSTINEKGATKSNYNRYIDQNLRAELCYDFNIDIDQIINHNENSYDIFCLNQTKLNGNETIQIDNFEFIAKHRNSRGVGVGVLIKKGIEYERILAFDKFNL